MIESTSITPKTEHHPGHDRRVIPLFPELRPILEEAYELASVGAEYVVGGGYRDAALSKDGWKNYPPADAIPADPKGIRGPLLAQAVPKSPCQPGNRTDPCFPLHVVTEWLGNTPQVALTHYLRVTDEDFTQACGEGVAKSGAPNAANHNIEAELNEMTSMWPLLSADLRQAILASSARSETGEGRGPTRRCGSGKSRNHDRARWNPKTLPRT